MQACFCNRSVNKRQWYWPLTEWTPRIILKHEGHILKCSSRVCGQMFTRKKKARLLHGKHLLGVESARWSSTSYVMVSKIKAKIQMKPKMSCIHWKSCPHHVGWVIFVLHYSEEIPHIRMANMGTEKHELTGREQNRPLNWPFFLKLWPWQNFSTESSDLVQEATLGLWPRAIRTISYI